MVNNHHLQTFSEKSGRKVNGTRLFGSSQRKISGSNGRPEKVVLFFLMKYYKQKFDTSFRPSRPFFSKWNWLYKWYPVPGSQDSGEKSFSQSKGVKRNARNARGLGGDRALSPIFPAATAPFPKSRGSYFRSVRFNTSPLCYKRAWHRLVFCHHS